MKIPREDKEDREVVSTDRPPGRGETLDLAYGKIDAIISEVRGARMWRERTERSLKDQTDRLDRIEGATLQILALSKDIGGTVREAQATAERALRTAKAAETKAERGSWTDEVAREAATAHLKNVSEEERQEIRMKSKRRATRLKITYAFAVALIGSLSGALAHLLMR